MKEVLILNSLGNVYTEVNETLSYDEMVEDIFTNFFTHLSIEELSNISQTYQQIHPNVSQLWHAIFISNHTNSVIIMEDKNRVNILIPKDIKDIQKDYLINEYGNCLKAVQGFSVFEGYVLYKDKKELLENVIYLNDVQHLNKL